MPLTVFRAFRSRNYALFFSGQGLSLVGSFIQSTAFSWILYQLTGSPLKLGYLSALMQLPIFIMLPIAGVLADRHNRYRLLLLTQTLFTLQSMGLAVLAFTGHLGVGAIVVMGLFQGVVTALDGPPRLALVPRLVDDPRDLPAAISLNSAMFNAARSVGPPVAGFLMAETSEAFCFLANGISYFFVIGGLLLMRLPHEASRGTERKSGGLTETYRYLRLNPELTKVLTLTSSVALVTMSVYILMPVWARDILKAGPKGLGLLMGGLGLGALAGAITVGSQSQKRMLVSLQHGGGLCVAVALMLFSLANSLVVSMILCFVLGFAFTSQTTSANTLLQLQVDDSRRAGVMSVLLFFSYGSIPAGNLVGGSLASWIGPHKTAFAGGAVLLAVTLVFLARELREKRTESGPFSAS